MPPVLLIGYDLRAPGRDYSKLVPAIQSLGPWWHHLDSTWFVTTSQSAQAVRDYLIGFIDANDKLFVANVVREAAWYGLTKEESDWVLNNLPAL
jgi:hypothetical protein